MSNFSWSTTSSAGSWYVTTATDTQAVCDDNLERFKDFLEIFNKNIQLKNEPFLKDRKDHLAEIEELFEI